MGTMTTFAGCTKTEDDKPPVPAPPADAAASNDHEVVVVVRAFMEAIEGGDYDKAIDMGTPDEFNQEGLGKVNEAFEFVKINVAEAFVGALNAAVLIDSVSGPSGPGQFGFALVRSGNDWLIRDADWLPDSDAVKKWLAGFKGVEPDAERVAGAD
ncbi:MAG: hypothetical protein GY809_29060 [Planctomycetes bacterium]|nr:hypothetical protein [Planctomycetota bacterium]